VSRGIPLSNSNQLWGLLWGAVAFGEFHGWSHGAAMTAVYGSIVMTCGLAAISFSTADQPELGKWRTAAQREQTRYRIDSQFVSLGMEGKSQGTTSSRRWLDWVLVAVATAVFVWTGFLARWPAMTLNRTAVYALIAMGIVLFGMAAGSLWRVTRFN
jgi:hypothetical protein